MKNHSSPCKLVDNEYSLIDKTDMVLSIQYPLVGQELSQVKRQNNFTHLKMI